MEANQMNPMKHINMKPGETPEQYEARMIEKSDAFIMDAIAVTGVIFILFVAIPIFVNCVSALPK